MTVMSNTVALLRAWRAVDGKGRGLKRTTELLIIFPVIPVTLRTNISYS